MKSLFLFIRSIKLALNKDKKAYLPLLAFLLLTNISVRLFAFTSIGLPEIAAGTNISTTSAKYTLTITQTILPDGGCNIYQIKNDSMMIQNCEVENLSTTLYRYKLESEDLDKIHKAIPAILELNEKYHTIMIDGFQIDIELHDDTVLKKRISIENENVPELKSLFTIINSVIQDSAVVPIIIEK